MLCAMSAVMALGTLREVITRSQRESSVRWLFCEDPSTQPTGALWFWSYLYYLSKYYELLDTVLQLLKGRPPPHFALHVYHHGFVLLMAWAWLEYVQTLQYIGLLFNTSVHVLMYYYYYRRVMGLDIWWKKFVTWFQIVQFATSLCCFAVTLFMLRSGVSGPSHRKPTAPRDTRACRLRGFRPAATREGEYAFPRTAQPDLTAARPLPPAGRMCRHARADPQLCVQRDATLPVCGRAQNGPEGHESKLQREGRQKVLKCQHGVSRLPGAGPGSAAREARRGGAGSAGRDSSSIDCLTQRVTRPEWTCRDTRFDRTPIFTSYGYTLTRVDSHRVASQSQSHEHDNRQSSKVSRCVQ